MYYRLRVLIRQGDVLLWLTAFDEIAAIIVGIPASEYGSLDLLGLRKLVDSVVGLHFFGKRCQNCEEWVKKICLRKN